MSDGLVVQEPYPAEVVEYAYQLWAFECSRSPARVAERLNNLKDSDPLKPLDRIVKPDTIRAWSNRKKWVERVSRDLRSVAPGVHEQVVVDIVAGSIDAVSYLRSVITDDEADTRYRVDAAKTILDRAGHLPYNRPSDDTRPPGPSRDYSHAIAGLSDEELAARLFGLPEGKSSDQDHTDPAT